MFEIWTAVRKEETEQGTLIIFEVKDKNTSKTREEERYENALPLMMTLGGYPSVMAAVMLMKPLPWCFHKIGDNIYFHEPETEKEQ